MKYFLSVLFLSFKAIVSLSQAGAVGDDKFKIVIQGSPLKIPYYANSSIDVPKNNFKHAIIAIHGVERNANDYYSTILSAAALRPKLSDSTYFFAPQFITEEDITFHKLDAEHLYWTSGGWSSGSNSRSETTNPRPQRLASFEVMDSVLSRIVKSFPQMKTITIAGHSAGGQFLNRYLASSVYMDDLCSKHKISLKFLVANPSSFLYMNNKRFISGTMDKFEVPNTTCVGYNDWRYGLDNMFTYPAAAGKDAIVKIFKRRNVVYLTGQLDNDPNGSNLGTSCEDRLQGSHRLERALIYFNHLKDVYGQEILTTQSQELIPNVGHDHFKMFISDKSLFHLFESKPNSCQQTVTSLQSELINRDLRVYPNPSSSSINIISGNGGVLRISDLQGRILKEIHVTGLAEEPIEIEFLKSGVYLFILENQHSKSIVRFVKT
jgi:hypothetical protein